MVLEIRSHFMECRELGDYSVGSAPCVLSSHDLKGLKNGCWGWVVVAGCNVSA